ncbi:hypothetical protein pb186bvf_017090 [Paramecium bursaria]
MISFILFVLYNIGNCIHQLNPLSETPYFQTLNKLFDFDGHDVQISGPSLGFSIQGGIVEGTRQKLIIQNSTIISTSFSELNTIAILSLDDEYRVDLVQIDYQGYFQAYHENLFKISNHKCQLIKNLGFYRVMVHCLTENNEVIIFFHEQEVTKYNTTHILNDADKLESVSIQIKQEWEYFHNLVIYVFYIFKDYSEAYEMSFGESVSFQLIWKESNYQYKQIQVVGQQIFYLYSSIYSSRAHTDFLNKLGGYIYHGENYLTMSTEYVKQYQIVYVVTKDSIITFNEQVNFVRKIDLPYKIDQSQLHGNKNFLYLLTENSTLIYKIQKDGELVLYQYSNQSMVNNLGVFGSISDIFITFEYDIMHIFQLFNYSLYNPSPSESGLLNLSFYSIDILLDYQGDLVPKKYFQEEDQLELQQLSQIKGKIQLSDYFEGPDIENQIGSLFESFIKVNESPRPNKFTDAQILLAYPLDQFEGYITLNITHNVFQTQIFNYNSTDESVWQFQVKINDNIEKILVLETKSQEILALLINNQLVQVYEIKPLKEVTHRYELSISYFPHQLNINKAVVFENQLLLHNGQGHEYFDIFADTHYYCGSRGQYDFVSVQRKGAIDILFQTEYFKIDIVNYGLFKWSYNLRTYFDHSQQDHILYPIPLDQCMILMNTNTHDTQLYYYDNFYKIKDIGQKYNYQINVEELIFQPSQLAYSNQHFYIWVQSKESQDNYIYIFGCSDNQINHPKKIISITGPVQRINAYSSFRIEADFITYQIENTTFIQQIPFQSKLMISAKQQQELEEEKVEDRDDIQDGTNESSNENSNKNFNNQTDPILNPQKLFNGTIQYYSLNCEKCDFFNSTPIFQISGNYTAEGSFIHQFDKKQYLFIQSKHEIHQTELATSPQQEPQEIELEPVYKIWENGNNQILLTFIEIESQTLSWIYQDGQSIYVFSMIKNQTTSRFIVKASNIFMKGSCKLGLDNTYNCYYYAIQDNNQILKVVVEGIIVDDTNYNQPPFLIIARNQEYMIFGSLLINKAQRIYGMLLNVTLNDFQLQSYKIINFEEILQNNLYNLQQIRLLDTQAPKYESETYINIAYATLKEAGRIRLLFDKMELISYEVLCNFNNVQHLKENKIIGFKITAKNYQVAALNEFQIMGKSFYFVELFLVDDFICLDAKQIESYALFYLDSTNDLLFLDQSINYLSNDHLLLSFEQGSIIFNIQKYLSIDNSTNGNAQISPIIQYNKLQKAKAKPNIEQLQIMLFILISVFTLLSIIFLILYRYIKIQKRQGQVQTQNESIEVPSE